MFLVFEAKFRSPEFTAGFTPTSELNRHTVNGDTLTNMPQKFRNCASYDISKRYSSIGSRIIRAFEGTGKKRKA